MKKNIFFSIFIFFILLSEIASAQDTPHSRFGVAVGMVDNIHSADFIALPGIPGCCTKFNSGSGNGFAINILYEYAVNDFILIGGRVGFLDHSATLTASTEHQTVFSDSLKWSGNYTRSLDLVGSSFGIEPQVSIRIIKGLMINAGIRIGFLLSPKFIQRETASSGTFPDSTGKDSKSNVRNQYAGALPNPSSVLLHGVFSLGYEFPLNKKHTTFIVPEITYTPAFNDMVKGLTWKTNAVIYGVVLKFSID